ncbi:MAG: hypothetical protein ACJ72H_20990 [Candidatus Sulfotelmatobacter sp.]
MTPGRHISPFVLRSIALLLVSTYLSLISCRSNVNNPPANLPSSRNEQATTTPASVADISSGIDLSKQPGTLYQVTYAPDVVRVSAETVKHSLLGANRDHDIYIFRTTTELRSKLVPGKVVLFEGLSFKKIQAIAEDGSHLIVGTENAPLNQLFKDADIRWHTPVNFLEIHNRQVQALSRSRNAAHRFSLPWLAPAPVHAAETEAKEEEEEGWHVKYDTDFSPDKVDFQVQLTRSGDLDASITGKGYVKNFDSSLALTVNNGQVNKFDFSNQNVNGIIDFDWTIGASGKPPELGEEKLKLPALMSVPFYIGALPFTLELGEALLFHPAFSAKQEIAKGAFHVDYSGVTGLSVTRGSGGEPTQQDTSNATSDSSIQTSTAFSPMAAFGVVVAVAIPRFELKTGTEEFLPPIPDALADRAAALLEHTTIGHFVKKAKEALKTEAAGTFQVVLSSTASHSGMLSLVPCQRFTLHVEGQVSADATVLGMPKELLKTTTIFKKDIDQPTPNAKICTG